MVNPSGRAFEEEIATWLLEYGGCLKSLLSRFDPLLGLDTVELFTFTEAT